MGDSIIYVGSKNMSRKDRYYKKDNWGMYARNEGIYAENEKEYKKTVERRFYTELITNGKVKKFYGPEKRKLAITNLFNKYGNLFMNKETMSSILRAYQSCVTKKMPIEERQKQIQIQLKGRLDNYGIKKSIQKKLYEYDPLFPNPTNNKKKSVSKNNKQDDFYNTLCELSRRTIPTSKQSKEADELIEAFENKISTKKTVIAVFNSYYLCCLGSTSQKNKNKRIKNNLENYLIRNKVDARIRKRILAVEEIK